MTQRRIRMSPTLSSSPTEISDADAERSTRKRRTPNSDALSLSLHVIGTGLGFDDGDEPVPLKIYNPNSSAEMCLRRSPRSSTNMYRSVNQQSPDSRNPKSVPALLSPSLRTTLRRSPRLSSPATESGCRSVNSRKSDATLECKLIEASVKRRRVIGTGIDFDDGDEPVPLKIYNPNSEKCLRRSPRSSTNMYRSVTQQSPQSRNRKSVPALLSPSLRTAVRRSQRLSSPATESDGRSVNSRKSDATLECKLIEASVKRLRFDESSERVLNAAALCGSMDEPASKKVKASLGKSNLIMAEKCLRSRKVPFRVVWDEDVDVKSALIQIPEKNETPLGSSEKCLRSRKIQFRVIGAEKVESPSCLIEWPISADKRPPVKSNTSDSSEKKQRNHKVTSFFAGEPIPDDEARERWRWRYELKSQRLEGQSWILNADEEDEMILNVECHYSQAKVDGYIFNLGDCAYIKGKGRKKDVGRILEFFKTTEGEDYFRVQWFFRAEDTVMKEAAAFHDKKRLFRSTLMNDNLLDCIVAKVNVIERIPPLDLQSNPIQPSDFYYDMEYCVEYSTFRNLLADNSVESRDLSSPNYIDTFHTAIATTPLEDFSRSESCKPKLALLDLYSGCGGMSTGLCLGAKLSNVNLVTRWAVDYEKSACASLKLNHPETQVRNTTAEDFLELLKAWEKLCKLYLFNDFERTLQSRSEDTGVSISNVNAPAAVKIVGGEFEVSCLVDICYGDPSNSGKHGLNFKVRWKGYDSSEDTWEPIEGLSNCQEHIRDFVRSGLKSKILPVPGDVDVICGGPPCQGISGYNRYRNVDSPLTDERNRQIIVFMDIVEFLKPKYVLMENVVDILRFDKASLGRYALSRLVHMKYQARLGTMAAGCYGLPQFRLRVFLWGALPSEKLPQFPLPTHDVVVRYWPPSEFEQNTVGYDEGQPRDLEEAVILRDAISDLPAVTSHEVREEMTYEMPPETEFQKYIRLTKYEMMGLASSEVPETKSPVLYDHRPYQLSEDDYLRVCQIPRRKGANFRDFPGVVVTIDNVVRRDPKREPVMLPSGRPMVPDYVFTFEKGKSKRPFARVWWDETVGTVVTFPNLHSQAALHPEQDRVLTLREYARLQGFPDFYRFCGTVKERYCQVGNAVAVPVARALGYSLGIAFRKLSGDGPLMTLPPKFSFQISPIDEICVEEN